MNTVQFETIVQNGMISLPSNQPDWNGKKIKVLILDASEILPESEQIQEREADFFAYAGIWQDHNISQESIRNSAWRKTQR